MQQNLKFKKGSIYENGYGIIAKKAMIDTRLSIEAKAIYAYIASYAGSGNTAFPSVNTILHHLKISKTRFYKYREELIKYGYIKVDNEKSEGKFTKNIYYILDAPFPSFEDTENEDTRNKDTNNNSININSYINNNKNNNKGFLTKTLSFLKFIDLVGLDNQYIIDAISYYLNTYREYIGKNHPNLKGKQWKEVVYNIFETEDSYGRYIEFNLEEMYKIIDQHFQTDYGECDYNILHFISGDIRLNRYYEIQK